MGSEEKAVTAFTRWTALALPATGMNWYHAASDAAWECPSSSPEESITLPLCVHPRAAKKQAGRTRKGTDPTWRQRSAGRVPSLHRWKFNPVTFCICRPHQHSLFCCCSCCIGSHYLAQASPELVILPSQTPPHHRPGLETLWKLLIMEMRLPLSALSG